MADAQRRHPFATEQLGSFYAAMSRDDLIAFVDQDWIIEAKPLDGR
jgi:hypothetical protein